MKAKYHCLERWEGVKLPGHANCRVVERAAHLGTALEGFGASVSAGVKSRPR